MDDDVHTIRDGLDDEGGSKGTVNQGDHTWEGLTQLTKGLNIKNRHGWVCRALSIQDLWSHECHMSVTFEHCNIAYYVNITYVGVQVNRYQFRIPVLF